MADENTLIKTDEQSRAEFYAAMLCHGVLDSRRFK